MLPRDPARDAIAANDGLDGRASVGAAEEQVDFVADKVLCTVLCQRQIAINEFSRLEDLDAAVT